MLKLTDEQASKTLAQVYHFLRSLAQEAEQQGPNPPPTSAPASA